MKTVQKNKKLRGFTIIEVVLVLAIAGLIFLMVFIALPAMNRGQRNRQRSNDMNRIAAAAIDYIVSNNKSPFVAESGSELSNQIITFVRSYIDSDCTVSRNGSTWASFSDCSDKFMDPNGENYGILVRSFEDVGSGYITKLDNDVYDIDIGDPFGNHGFNYYIFPVVEGMCSTSYGHIEKNPGKKNFAILYTLEGGAVYCIDSRG